MCWLGGDRATLSIARPRCFLAFTSPIPHPLLSPMAKLPPKPLTAPPAPPALTPDSLPFEDALAQIESIIERIESGEVGLEQSLAEYERGVTLINHCRGKLDAARQKVEDLTRKLQQPEDGADEGSSPDDSDE